MCPPKLVIFSQNARLVHLFTESFDNHSITCHLSPVNCYLSPLSIPIFLYLFSLLLRIYGRFLSCFVQYHDEQFCSDILFIELNLIGITKFYLSSNTNKNIWMKKFLILNMYVYIKFLFMIVISNISIAFRKLHHFAEEH